MAVPLISLTNPHLLPNPNLLFINVGLVDEMRNRPDSFRPSEMLLIKLLNVITD